MDVTADPARQREMERHGYSRNTTGVRANYLRAALYLAHEDGKLQKPPSIPSIQGEAKKGFLEPDQVASITGHLAWPYDDIVRLLHMTGWRTGEVLGLRWEWVEWKRNTILLPDSKNGEPRRIEMVAAIAELMRRAWKHRSLGIGEGKIKLVEYVFHVNGAPIARFRDRWHTARKRAGLPACTPHDLRRSMAKDASDAGYDQASIMALGGWKSPGVFRRYRIVDPRRTAEVLSGLQSFRSRTNGTDTAALDSQNTAI